MTNLTRQLANTLMICTLLFASFQVNAVTGRNPTGVNVNSNGASTVLITFHNLDANEIPVDAFWCGDVSSTGVVVGTNPCVAGTLLGHLPEQFDLSRISGGGNSDIPTKDLPHSQKQLNRKLAPRNLTDVMSIPTAVIRRAYQQAQSGASSEFYYIRQFSNNGINTYVTVTCRMAGGGARSPLSLTEVDLDFSGSDYRKAVTLVKQSETLPEFNATVSYTGSGLLKGRWEIVLPGEPEPSRFDLLSEASLPASERGLQKRYRLISRFQKFLTPSGRAIIPGPDPKLLPTLQKGLYRVLLRIEASSDKEGNSDTTAGILKSGGVAGFPMPTLRYFVGSEQQLKQNKKLPPITLLLPHSGQQLTPEQVNFTWFDLADSQLVSLYRLEIYDSQGEQALISSALVHPGQSSYIPPESILKKLRNPFLWRVSAIDKKGKTISTSSLRKLTIN